MAIEVTKLVWKVNLLPGEKWLLVALSDFASEDGTRIFPGTALLARMTGYSPRWIKKVRKDLVALGVLVLVAESTPTQPAEYRIDLDVLLDLARTGAFSSPGDSSSPGEVSDLGVVNSVHRGGELTSPKPPIEPLEEPPPAEIGKEAAADIEATVEKEFGRASQKTAIGNPEAYKRIIRERKTAEYQAEEATRQAMRRHQQIIDDCRLCNSDGLVLIELEHGPVGEPCIHDTAEFEGLAISTAAT